MLGIPYYVADFHDRFEAEVISDFVEEYQKGRTPNPCVVCNRKIKWSALMQWGEKMGAQYVATGHYANIVRLPNGRYALKRAKTAKERSDVRAVRSDAGAACAHDNAGRDIREGRNPGDRKESGDSCGG